MLCYLVREAGEARGARGGGGVRKGEGMKEVKWKEEEEEGVVEEAVERTKRLVESCERQ